MKKIIIMIIFLLTIGTALAQNVLAINKNIIDESGKISQLELQSLNSNLKEYNKQKGVQIYGLLMNRIGQTNLQTYTQNVYEENKLGGFFGRNASLLVIEIGDKKVGIHRGDALMESIPKEKQYQLKVKVQVLVNRGKYEKAMHEYVEEMKYLIDKYGTKSLWDGWMWMLFIIIMIPILHLGIRLGISLISKRRLEKS